MKYSRLWLSAAIIAFVVVIGFVLSVPHTRDVGKVAQGEDTATSVSEVTLHDSYKKGVHTISGSLVVPNACTNVIAEASLVGDSSAPSGILVALSAPKDSGVCLQVPMPANFTVTITAPAHLPISATINGTAATTTVS